MTDETLGKGGSGGHQPEDTFAYRPATPASDLSPNVVAAASTRVGNYRLLEKIGEGGMGDVYAAEQVSPLQRRVALKILKPGMDTRDFIARFESERQALALMDHPCIARVFDAGATDSGRPFFVMELVAGVPLLQHCDSSGLGVRQRVDLFIKVCEGVQHAHQKAIIHRDLKPSNVLVAVQEGVAWPKIIDFGVAKTLGQKLVDQTVHTELGQLVGSPVYMSPEQAELTGYNIDTQTDIYQLGVLLYELLTGVLPFDQDRWRAAGLPELLRLIREVDPPRPSLRVVGLDAAEATAVAAARGVATARLVNQLQGELDWIVMSAMEKERARRYQTAAALVQDLQNHLQDRPVQACPPSRAYRLRKFVRRNRTAVMSAAAVLAAIVLGIFGTTAGMVQARRSARVATAEAEAAKQVADFLVGLFNVSDPGEARGNSVTAREILDQGVQRIESGLATQPLTRARLMNAMGRVYKELGLYEPARPLLENALNLLHAAQAREALDAAAVRNDLGTLLWKTGDYAAAQVQLEASLAVRERELGPDHPDVAQSLNSLGNLYWINGELQRARTVYGRALNIRERSLGPNDPETAITLNNLGGLSMKSGDFAAARSYLERALQIRQTALGADHPDVANSLMSLGSLFDQLGDLVQARDHYQGALAIREKVLGPAHPLVATTLNNLAGPLGDLGDFAEAEAAYVRAAVIQRAALPADHLDLASTLSNHAVLLRKRGDTSRARDLFERALSIYAKAVGPDHNLTATCQSNLAVALLDLGDFSGARELLTRTLEIQQGNFGPDHPDIALTLKNLGDASNMAGDVATARAYFQDSVAMWERVYGPEHRDVAVGLQALGQLLTAQNDFAAARPVLERALAIREAAFGPDNIEVAVSLSDLGLLCYYKGELEQARALFQRAVAIQDRRLPGDNPALVNNYYNLACVTALLGNRPGALACLRRAVEGGFADPYLDEDPDLGSLHGDPEYQQLVRTVKTRAAGR